MKKIFSIAMLSVILIGAITYTTLFTNCTKDEPAPKPTLYSAVKMQVPNTTFYSSSQLLTKSGSNRTVTKLIFEFYYKPTPSSNWTLIPKSVFAGNSTAYAKHQPIWETNYDPDCNSLTCQPFIDVPLNMPQRVAVKAKDGFGNIKFYGVKDFTPVITPPATTFPTVTTNLYEINSRIEFNVENLFTWDNYKFEFQIIRDTSAVSYNSILQSSTHWLVNALPETPTGTVRNWQDIPSLGVAKQVPSIDLVIDGSNNTIKKNGNALTSTDTFYLIEELFAKESINFQVKYKITRISDNYIVKDWSSISNLSGSTVPVNFNAMNWLQAGFDFKITFTANPLVLGGGLFCGQLFNNGTFNGSVNL